MKPIHSSLGLVLAACFCAAPQAHAVTLFGSNLIVNGGAEAGPGSADGSVVPVPGFSSTAAFTAVQYGAGGGFPLATDAGPPDRGLNFFAGGPDAASSSAHQQIDVSSAAAALDQGASFALSAWLGGFAGQNDNAVLSITFLSAASLSLGTAAIGPVSADDRVNFTGLLNRFTVGSVPLGTRAIGVDLLLTRTDGSYDDGYADSLSLVLTAAPVPEPASGALLAGGLAALGGWARRRTALLPVEPQFLQPLTKATP